MKPIYMDYAATTPVHQDVIEAMYPLYSDLYGNPSSVHYFGRKARHQLDEARREMARGIQANERDIIFTSGGTEANNLALIGVALANKHKGKHIITTEQEHHATLHAVQYLEQIGFNVTYLPVSENGKVNLADVTGALTEETILVSVMFVNNETGVVQPIEQIGQIVEDHQTFFHTDAVQAFGQIPIDVQMMNIDLLSVSSHKINGPKGSGFLYVQDDIPLQPLRFGGEQERKRRPGTENVIQIAGFQRAVQLAIEEKDSRYKQYQKLKQLFLQILQENDVDFAINGDCQSSVPTIVNVSFPGTKVETLLTNLDLSGIAASSGSACTAGSIEPSHVLAAMFGTKNERTTNSIRFSFGLNQTSEIIEEAANRITKILNRLS